MEIGTLLIFQANSEINKITDVTSLVKVDRIRAARMLNPLLNMCDLSRRRLVTSRRTIKHNIHMIYGNEHSALC